MIAAHRPVVRVALSVLLAAAMLAACGQAGAPPTATPAPVTVRFAFRTNVANYVGLAQAFHEKYPHITVQLLNSNSFQSQAQTPGAGSALTLLKMQAVDVYRDTVPYLASAQLKNELLPLDEYIAAYKAFPSTDFLPGLLDTVRIEGTQIGIPAGVNPIVAYYDAARLKAANLQPPPTNWTIEQFLNIAVATNNQSSPGPANPNDVIGFCSDPSAADPVIITYLMGGQLVDNLQNPTRPTINSAANLRAVQWYASLHSEYGVMPTPQEVRQVYRRGIYEPISLGRCGVWLGFYGDMRGRSWGTLWLGDPVMMPLPRGQASFNAAAVDGYFVLRSAAHPQEAWLWLTFLLDHEEAAGTLMPPRSSHIKSQAFANRVTSDMAAVARSLPASTTIISIGSPYNLSSLLAIYAQAVAQVMSGEADAKTALSAAQERAQLLFGQ